MILIDHYLQKNPENDQKSVDSLPDDLAEIVVVLSKLPGGVLLGTFDIPEKIIYVVLLLPSPSDSVE